MRSKVMVCSVCFQRQPSLFWNESIILASRMQPRSVPA